MLRPRITPLYVSIGAGTTIDVTPVIVPTDGALFAINWSLQGSVVQDCFVVIGLAPFSNITNAGVVDVSDTSKPAIAMINNPLSSVGAQICSGQFVIGGMPFRLGERIYVTTVAGGSRNVNLQFIFL